MNKSIISTIILSLLLSTTPTPQAHGNKYHGYVAGGLVLTAASAAAAAYCMIGLNSCNEKIKLLENLENDFLSDPATKELARQTAEELGKLSLLEEIIQSGETSESLDSKKNWYMVPGIAAAAMGAAGLAFAGWHTWNLGKIRKIKEKVSENRKRKQNQKRELTETAISCWRNTIGQILDLDMKISNPENYEHKALDDKEKDREKLRNLNQHFQLLKEKLQELQTNEEIEKILCDIFNKKDAEYKIKDALKNIHDGLRPFLLTRVVLLEVSDT